MTLPGDFKIKNYQKKIFDRMTEVIYSGKKIILWQRCQGRKMSRYYFLNPDHTYIPCDLMQWCKQFETEDRKVAEDKINNFRVSTVWIGLDNQYKKGAPLVFETMIFKPDGSDTYCVRYTTWQQAEIGHKEAIEWVKGGCKEAIE